MFQRLPLAIFSILVLAFLSLPTLIVLPISFSSSQYLEFPPPGWSLRWYEAYLASPEWIAATLVSLKVATLNVIVTLTFGGMAAYGLHVGAFRRKGTVFGLLMTPMIFPIILLAIGSFYLFSKLGMLNTMFGLVVAHSALTLPIVIIFIGAALRGYDMNQERAAQSLGAHPLWAFLTITLPQLRFSFLTAGLFAFLTSFDEVVIAIFLAGGDATTLPRRMFNALRDIMDPTVAAISSWVLLMTAAMLVATQLLSRNGDR